MPSIPELRGKKMKKLFLMILFITLSFTLNGCKNSFLITYFDGISDDNTYNTELFYRNDLFVTQAADPSVIYVSEEQNSEYGGYFYMYVTGLGFPVMRSKNLVDWEKQGFSLQLPEETWCNSHFWAPEVIYNENDGKFYLYYTSSSKVGTRETAYSDSTYDFDRLYTGIAVSDNPVGPFIPWTGTNLNGEVITNLTPPINFKTGMDLDYEFPVIDASPFFDDNGDFYLYFTAHISSTNLSNNIWGMKMKDMVTPDYNTVTQLTEAGKYTVGGEMILREEGSNIDEGPFMIKHDGRYYLTYSAFGFSNRLYSVNFATATNPLGPFTKAPTEEANPVLGIDSYYDHMGGTGHHCFVKAGEDLYAVYHAHRNRATGAGNPRGIAIDKVNFRYNETLGYDVLHANGPTYSLQPLPSFVSGYKNLAREALISATNVQDEKIIKYLNDDLIAFHDFDLDKEFIFKGKTTITLEFTQPTKVTAVMVYNSLNYDYAFESIDSIVFSVLEKPANYIGNFYNKGVIKNIPFNPDYVRTDELYMRAGGAAIVEFAPLLVDRITITISKKYTNVDYYGEKLDDIAISEIVVLGKESE